MPVGRRGPRERLQRVKAAYDSANLFRPGMSRTSRPAISSLLEYRLTIQRFGSLLWRNVAHL